MNFFRECCILLQYGHSLSTRAAAFAVISRSSPGGSAAADDFLLIRNSFQKTCSPFCTFGRQFGICPGICAVFYWQFVTAQYPHSNHLKIVTVQCLTVTCKNPFQIGFADGIFAFKPVFYYGQRSKCADLLNSYDSSLFTTGMEVFSYVYSSNLQNKRILLRTNLRL